LKKERFSKENIPPLFIDNKYFEKWEVKADNQKKWVLGEMVPAFFAYLFMSLTEILFETNLPTGITCGDEDLLFHNTKLRWDGTKTAAEFAIQILKAGGKFCVVSVKNWALPTIYNFLPEQIKDLKSEFENIDPNHFGKWVLVIPHVSYPLSKQIESYNIEIIQTTYQIFPVESEEEEQEQKQITLHWLRILKEILQPLLIEYFEANICYSSNEILDAFIISPLVSSQNNQFICSSVGKMSNNHLSNSLFSL
jgi:hypothetical protein